MNSDEWMYLLKAVKKKSFMIPQDFILNKVEEVDEKN
jgi:hypothetical protein